MTRKNFSRKGYSTSYEFWDYNERCNLVPVSLYGLDDNYKVGLVLVLKKDGKVVSRDEFIREWITVKDAREKYSK